MRIVMTTDDVMIDRRILLEADSLINSGHEVILLAAREEGEGRFSWEGRLKVERVSHLDLPPPSRDQKLCEQRLPYHSVSEAISGLSGLFLWIPRPVRVGIKLQVLAVYMLYAGVARLRKGLSGRPGKGRSATEGALPAMNAWDRVLLDRLVFYRPDVIHAHDLPQLRSAVEAAKSLGAKVVYDAHEAYPFIGTLTRDESGRLERIERELLRSVDVAVTVNPRMASFFAEHYGIDPPHVVRNSTRPSKRFDPRVRKDLIRARLGLSASEKILIFQGWVDLRRGLRELVLAMASVSESIHLVLLGYTTQKEEIARLSGGAGARVHFLPAVPWEEVEDFLASADAGIIPYKMDEINHRLCSPNKLSEFINAALPIIASDGEYLRDVVQGCGFGIVRDLEGEHEIAGAIAEMFGPDLSGAERFRRNILEKREEFLWDVDERVLLDIYPDNEESKVLKPAICEIDP